MVKKREMKTRSHSVNKGKRSNQNKAQYKINVNGKLHYKTLRLDYKDKTSNLCCKQKLCQNTVIQVQAKVYQPTVRKRENALDNHQF